MVGQEEKIMTADPEVIKLKRKINMQVDKIIELTEALKLERIKNNNLEDHNKKFYLPAEEHEPQLMGSDNYMKVLRCLSSFFSILKKIIEKEEFITYKNYSKNSALYCKVEKTLFDNYLDQYPDIEKKLFFNFCVDFSLMKSEERKYIWNDGTIRIYFINKNLVNIVKGEYNAE